MKPFIVLGAVIACGAFLATFVNSSSGAQISVTALPQSPYISLTHEGSADWAHWGLNSALDFNHRSGVPQEISNLSLIGSGSLNRFTDGSSSITWGNGTPTASALSTTTGVNISGLNSGFEIATAADTTTRTLRFYCQLSKGTGLLEASLSDASHPAYSTTIDAGTTTTNICFTIRYSSSNAAQSLNLRWSLTSINDPLAKVGVHGATLAHSFPPQAPTDVTASGGNNLAIIRWKPVPAASHYHLYIARQPGVTASNYSSLDGGSQVKYVNSPFYVTDLQNGVPYYARLTTVNAYGESVESTEVSAVPQAPLPNSPPSVSLTNPISGTSLPEPAVVILQAGASDSNGTIARVEFYNGSNRINSDASSPYAFTWSIPIAGSYSLTARAFDNGGLFTTSNPVSVTITRTATAYGNSSIEPVADAQVRNASHDSDNFGFSNLLQVEKHNKSERRSLLKFDLASITGSVSNATLRVYGGISASNRPVSVDCMAISDSSWQEHTVTFQNQPSIQNLVSSATLTDNSSYVEFDLTQYVQSEKALGKNLVSLALVVNSASPGVVEFFSRESGATSPELNVVSETFLPTAVITTPFNNAAFRTEFSHIHVAADAYDMDGTIKEVQFYAGPTLIGSDFSSPYTTTWERVSAGTYNLTALALDNTAVSSASAPIRVTVDATQGSGLWTHEVQLRHFDRSRNGFARLWYETERIKGVVVVGSIIAGHNFATNSILRSVAKENELAILFTGSREFGFAILQPQFKDEVFITELLQLSANISGKPEIEHAPWILFGHSTDGLFIRNMACWKPERAAGILYYKSGNLDNPTENYFLPLTKIRDVPFLAINGRYEEFGPNGGLLPGESRDTQWWAVRDTLMRLRMDQFRVSNLVEWYGIAGHLSWSDESMEYMAKFVDKVAKTRLPNTYATTGPVELITIPESSGWLSTTMNEVLMDQPDVELDPVEASYNDWPANDRANTFWHIDQPLTIDWINYHYQFWGSYE